MQKPNGNMKCRVGDFEVIHAGRMEYAVWDRVGEIAYYRNRGRRLESLSAAFALAGELHKEAKERN